MKNLDQTPTVYGQLAQPGIPSAQSYMSFDGGSLMYPETAENYSKHETLIYFHVKVSKKA